MKPQTARLTRLVATKQWRSERSLPMNTCICSFRFGLACKSLALLCSDCNVYREYQGSLQPNAISLAASPSLETQAYKWVRNGIGGKLVEKNSYTFSPLG